MEGTGWLSLDYVSGFHHCLRGSSQKQGKNIFFQTLVKHPLGDTRQSRNLQPEMHLSSSVWRVEDPAFIAQQRGGWGGHKRCKTKEERKRKGRVLCVAPFPKSPPSSLLPGLVPNLDL